MAMTVILIAMVPLMVMGTAVATVPLMALSLRGSRKRAIAEAQIAYALAADPHGAVSA